MKVVQRKSVGKVKARINMWVPAWVLKELGFGPDDESDWVPIEDDNGERLVALRRIPKKEGGEGEEKKEEGEEGEKAT